MKNQLILFTFLGLILFASCKKEGESERFRLLTTPVWETDSLLADGVDASAPGMILEKFKGTAKFNKDGTGQFGNYTGKWTFGYNETQINIQSDSLPIPLVTMIQELTAGSLKINTGYPNPLNPTTSIKIHMTFKAKE